MRFVELEDAQAHRLAQFIEMNADGGTLTITQEDDGTATFQTEFGNWNVNDGGTVDER
jgi:hypothetical protein